MQNYGMPTFDIVCKLDHQEVENAVNQTKKEVEQRFDFRGTDTELELTKEGILLRSSTEQRLDAAKGVLDEKMIKRKVSLKSLDPQKKEAAGGSTYKQLIKLVEGIEQDKSKEIVKFIKDSKLKVQAAIQGDLVRITGKKKDDLQEAIALLKSKDFGIPLLYINFRD